MAASESRVITDQSATLLGNGGFEACTAQAIGELLLEFATQAVGQRNLVAPAARSAAGKLDAATLAGLRNGHDRAAVAHWFNCMRS